MQLIDAGKLFKAIKADESEPTKETKDYIDGYCEGWNALFDIIEDQPTVYDPEMVVKQLEKLKSLVPVNRVLDDIVNDKPKELGMLIAYKKAIEIVKGGGVDEN